MSCEDIKVIINPDPSIDVTINPDPEIKVSIDGSGFSGGSFMIDKTPHRIEDASISDYYLKNGQSFRENTLLVFRNGEVLTVDIDYTELSTKTGVHFLIDLDDTIGDEDVIVFYYVVT